MDKAEFAEKIKRRSFGADELCLFICDLYGVRDKRPFDVKPSYYRAYKGIEIYRGLDCSEEMFNDYVEKFVYGDMFFINRLSVLGMGYYFADKKRVASFYTNKTKFGLFKKPIISAKIMPNAKFATKQQINEEFRNRLPEIKKVLLKKFDGLLTNEDIEYFGDILNSFAEPIVKGVILGYDGLVSMYGIKRNGNVYLVFNRGKLIIDENQIQFVKKEIEQTIQFD